MAVALSPHVTEDYVLKEDRALPPEQQTIWKVRPLTSSEHYHITCSMFAAVDMSKGAEAQAVKDHMDAGEEPKLDEVFSLVRDMEKLMEGQRLKVRCGLAGAENYRDERGNLVRFETERGPCGRPGPSREFLDRMAPHQIKELADAVDQRSKVPGGDSKN
jgi:hypothetical protein